MEDPKLELSGRPASEKPASYRVIPETDMEEEAVTRPKSLVKSKPPSPEVDGADEKMLPKEDNVDVKVSPNEKQNGDAKLDIGDLKSAFVGLTKEELMKYANDPFWVRLRWFLFITFWVLWAMMLVGAIMIICAAPKCDPPAPRTWWEKGPLTELEHDIEPAKVKALKEQGFTGVIIPWPEDAYVDFDETHDFITSLKKYKDEDLNVIVELEPGSTDRWYNSSEHKDGEFADYYIWRPPRGATNDGSPEPPNNWLTTENNSSWIYSEVRKEFYYAPRGRPHLNFRLPNVTNRFSDVLKKLLDYGVGGVRLRGVPFLLVDPKFENEGVRSGMNSQVTGLFMTDYGFYIHTKTEHLLDLAPLLREWQVIVKNKTDNGPFMVAEELHNIEAYKFNNSLVVDLPVQSHLFSEPNANVTKILNVLNSTFAINNITWPMWKCDSNEALEVVAYLLPGTPLVPNTAAVNKALLKVRNYPSVMSRTTNKTFSFQSVKNGTVFAFIRVAPSNPGVLVVYNPSKNRTEVDFPQEIPAISGDVTVQFYSNYNETGVSVNVKKSAWKFPLSPESAIVLTYVPKSSEN